MSKPYPIQRIEISLRDTKRPEVFDELWDGSEASTKFLEAGWQKEPGRGAFRIDTVWEKEVQIPMRDGVKIRVDIFRPADSDANPVPALIAWSPYGKSGRGQFLLVA
jgi:predicted acyl esterase